MPHPYSKTTYVRPLCENNEASIIQQRGFASPVQHFKASDHDNAHGLGEDINLKNMDEVKNLYLNNLNSVHTKLFAGVEEIQRWKTSVEMESRQKNKKVEELLQTIELQRKTILDLQLQNENISYQLSEEMEQRNFVIEKLHSTKELCSALKKHYNTLEKHYEYRNKIEETINTADTKRLKAIENLQSKFEKICREHSEKIGYLNDTLVSETNKALNFKEAVEQQLAEYENEKESLCSMIENYQIEIQNLSKEVAEEKNKAKSLIEEKNALKSNVQELEELNAKHVFSLEEIKENLRVLRNEKFQNENKLLSENKKMKDLLEQYEEQFVTATLHEKELEKNVAFLKETISNLECKINYMETKVEEEKQKNEVLTSSISAIELDKCNLEAIISDAKTELTSFEQLKKDYKSLEEQISDFVIKEKCYNTSLENLKEELLKYKSENERASELCNEKDENLVKVIEEYQNQLAITETKLKCLEENSSELQQEMKCLKNDLEENSRAIIAKDEKILNLESIVGAQEVQLETFRYENITLKDTIEMEKTSVKICLECEQLTEKLKHMKDLEITLRKTEDKLCLQTEETMEIMKMLNDTEKNYNEDRITKEREIIKFQELIRRLEDEISVMNVKLEELSTLKSLNEKLKQDIEDLKLQTNRQEELDILKSENKKLKDDLQDLVLKFQAPKNNFDEESDDKIFAVSVKQEVQDKLIEKKKKVISKTVGRKSKGKMKSCDQFYNKNQSEEKDLECFLIENKKNEKKSRNQLQDESGKGNFVEYAPAENINSKKVSNNQLQNKCSKQHCKEYSLTEVIHPKKDFTKDFDIVLKNNKIDSQDFESVHYQKDGKQEVLNLEKNKWELDSSGSEYLEIAYDKESENFMGLTPKKSPSPIVKLNALGIRKSSSFTSRLKRDIQTVSTDNNMKFGLPFKKNKTEIGNSVWMHSMKTPDRGSNFLRIEENIPKKNTSTNNTPSTPANKSVTGTPTIAGQRKFFKTPLMERDNKFKKPSSQTQWSDFLKSTK
ncbi:uncharacterized protein NPIL_236391 [Nephila pilipes]|uniref:Synaptonemal complex protein 1 n=1 Tax=Nephila pilipes TaxID=299642 RepID=A0A8X6N4Y3_NEPPI|nr:uncharacterized protein NPIL_236391 [Nephila pilipes]